MGFGVVVGIDGAALVWRPLRMGHLSVGSSTACGLSIPHPSMPLVAGSLLVAHDALQWCPKEDTSGMPEARALEDGDRLCLGAVTLQVMSTASQALGLKSSNADAGTRPMHLPNFHGAAGDSEGEGDSARQSRSVHLLCQHLAKNEDTSDSLNSLNSLNKAEITGEMRRLPMPEGPAVIGSDEAADICLSDRFVSRIHARIEWREGRLRIEDLSSRNGVWHSGVLVREAELGVGDTVCIGQTQIGWDFDSMQSLETVDSDLESKQKADWLKQILIGRSAAMESLRRWILQIAASQAPVLVCGESGTGKEVVAEAIFKLSGRADKPFCALNCGAISESLVGSELFGYTKGAFTGASRSKAGILAEAHTGTLFLDELGELPLAVQPHLLRVLENHEIRPIGATQSSEIDVRIIAATHRDLPYAVEEGTFREDLFHRLDVLSQFLPPLRERKEDLFDLVPHLMRVLAPKGSKPLPVSPAVYPLLIQHDWPGNVRELKNTLERSILMGNKKELKVEDIVFSRRAGMSDPMHFKDRKQQTLAAREARAIKDVLCQFGGSRKETAELLGIARSTLHRKIQDHGIELPSALGADSEASSTAST